METESTLGKAVAAVTPTESESERADARSKARSAAQPGEWLALALDQHLEIEDAFLQAKNAPVSQRRAALKHLAVVLTGHSNAEESVIYPALALIGEKTHAGHAYKEQATAKMGMAELERVTPSSPEFLQKLEHIRSAVAHHMYEEESTWFMQLKEKASADDQQQITARYREEYDRYVRPMAEPVRAGLPH
ncbi:MAG: hemerythrin domain-containing protein [Steroidobacteraceae bacterium]